MSAAPEDSAAVVAKADSSKIEASTKKAIAQAEKEARAAARAEIAAKKAAEKEAEKEAKRRAGEIAKVVPFNPLEKKVLGAAIAEVMLTTPVYPLETQFPRRGPGIYALYYTGDFPEYAPLAKVNRERGCVWPIYVGEALPGGGRIGIDVIEDGLELRGRIRKHYRSIKAAGDFKTKDFHYRALVMDDAFIRLGETSLLALYKPIWNNFVPGFGNNNPGIGRKGSKRSRWDTVHGGRAQAEDHEGRGETRELILKEIDQEVASTNFDLPETLINADQQSVGRAPDMDMENVVNKDAADLQQNQPDDPDAVPRETDGA